MKVLVLGMPRTGTQSLADALMHLGISPVYHMREVYKNNHQDLWVEAIGPKYEDNGAPWHREQFDKILGDYEAVADYPAAIFPSELIAAYPEAAVILTVRADEDVWHASMMSTLIHGHAGNPKPSLMATKYHLHCWNNDFPTHGREAYRAHNELVRGAARGREFLEYQPGMGWGPLCEFLGLQVPDVPYPRADDWLAYKKDVQGKEALQAKGTAVVAGV